MDNPGSIQLGLKGNAFAIAAPGVYIGDWVDRLEGMKSFSIQANFKYGSGGTSVVVYVQTSLDQGNTPMDVWAQQFATESGVEAVNLDDSAVLSPVVPQQQALTPGDTVNGFLGDRLRAVVVVTGTYAGASLLDVRAVVR